MTDSIRETIIAGIAARLEATKPTGVTVERFRTVPVQGANLPHTNVRPKDDDPEMMRDRGGVILNHLELVLEHRVKATGGAPADKAADPLVTWAEKQIMADVTQGKKAKSTRPGRVEWDADEGEAVYVLVKQPFIITYQTVRANPEANS